MGDKRKLTKHEIEDILSFIQPNPHILPKTAKSVVELIKAPLKKQLKRQLILPDRIPFLKNGIMRDYYSSLISPGECVGIVTAQSIGEKQTQTNLNVFHKAGSSDRQPVVFKFSELINATNKPKAPGYLVYFKEGNSSVQELRDRIGHSIVQLTFEKITKQFTYTINKEPENWYKIFDIMYPGTRGSYTDCISLDINMDILYEYKLTLKEVALSIKEKYSDMYCVFSPDCFARIDVYVDTSNIELTEKQLAFVTPENAKNIYLEEVVQPIIEEMVVCGIPGILASYFLKEDDTWILETENSRTKENSKFKKKKNKPADSAKRFRQILAHPLVDATRTITNNIWDIYFTLGVEASRRYMIRQFSEIMKGINVCHITLLVDKMTFDGTIASISRYSMRKDDTGVLNRVSFEEVMENILNAGVYGQDEPVRGVSASILCGKKPPIGTGLCTLSMDLDKLSKIEEEKETENNSDSEEDAVSESESESALEKDSDQEVEKSDTDSDGD